MGSVMVTITDITRRLDGVFGSSVMIMLRGLPVWSLVLEVEITHQRGYYSDRSFEFTDFTKCYRYPTDHLTSASSFFDTL